MTGPAALRPWAIVSGDGLYDSYTFCHISKEVT